MANVVRNTWNLARKGRSRAITIEIETTRPAGVGEFGLMSALTEVVERYLAHEDTTDADDLLEVVGHG